MNATFRGLLIALSIASLTLPLFGAAPLTIMARTGSGGITGIDPNIAINREGIIAFTGRDATGSRVFVVSSPNQVTGIVTASNRTHSGVGITSGMNPAVIARELVSGSSPITLIRKTPIAGGGSLVLGSSSSAPIDWDSVSGSVDISSGGIAVASALVNGSTLTRLFFGISRPMTPTPAAYSGNILLRPQISDSGEAVIRDKDGHIITMNVSGVVRIPADTSNGFASDTGNKPGISTDGTVIAFSGNRNGWQHYSNVYSLS